MAAKKSRTSKTKKKVTKKKVTKAPGKKKAAKKKAAKRPAAKRKPSAPKRKPSTTRRSAPKTDDRVGQIQRLIDVMVEAGAVEVELKEEGTRLRVRLKEDVPATMMPVAAPAPVPAVAAAPHAPASAAPAPAAESGGEADPVDGTVFTSPMVGTFYASPSPDSDPFVRVGDRVSEDTTVCILEAMKVMNDIKAELNGTVVKVLVQNGQPVEYGQPLFVIEVD